MADRSIKSLFAEAEEKRSVVESGFETTTDSHRRNLSSAIASYEECKVLADRLSLFSLNENLEDISTNDLPYG